MTKKLFSRRYVFKTAVMIAEVPPKAARNWLDRKQITAEGELGRGEKIWRRFSAFDILRLAITKKLVDFCVPVELAWMVASGVFVGEAAINFEKSELSPVQVAKRLRDRTIFAWRENDRWEIKYSKQIPTYAPAAVLSIDVARVALEILQELAEHDHEILEQDDQDERDAEDQ